MEDNYDGFAEEKKEEEDDSKKILDDDFLGELKLDKVDVPSSDDECYF